MDSDIKQILDLAEQMKGPFKKLTARSQQLFKQMAISGEQFKAVESAANQFRLFYDIHLAELQAAFDPEYSEELKKMTKMVKEKNE